MKIRLSYAPAPSPELRGCDWLAIVVGSETVAAGHTPCQAISNLLTQIDYDGSSFEVIHS